MFFNRLIGRAKMQKYLLTLRFSDEHVGQEFLAVVNEEWLISHDCNPSEGVKEEIGGSCSGWSWNIITYHYVPIDENGKINVADIEKLVGLSGCSVLEKELSINYDEY